MLLGQGSILGDNGGLQALGDEGCVDAAGALHMDVLQLLVQVCQHLGTQGPVAGLSLECVQLPQGECVQGAGRGSLARMKVESSGPEQVPNL